eukprot:2630773-Rhodomonas_salina.1
MSDDETTPTALRSLETDEEKAGSTLYTSSGAGKWMPDGELTLYRGIPDPNGDPFEKPADASAPRPKTLGSGSYWTTSLDEAQKYAQEEGAVFKIVLKREHLPPSAGRFVTGQDLMAPEKIYHDQAILEYFDIAVSVNGEGKQVRLSGNLAEELRGMIELLSYEKVR